MVTRATRIDSDEGDEMRATKVMRVTKVMRATSEAIEIEISHEA